MDTIAEANNQLVNKLEEVYKVINEAEAIADAYGITFHLSIAPNVGGMYDGGDTTPEGHRGWNPSLV